MSVSDLPKKVPKRLKFGTKTELVRAGLVRWKPDGRRRMVAGLVRFLSEHFAGLVRLESDEKNNSKQRMGGIVALQWWGENTPTAVLRLGLGLVPWILVFLCCVDDALDRWANLKHEEEKVWRRSCLEAPSAVAAWSLCAGWGERLRGERCGFRQWYVSGASKPYVCMLWFLKFYVYLRW